MRGLVLIGVDLRCFVLSGHANPDYISKIVEHLLNLRFYI